MIARQKHPAQLVLTLAIFVLISLLGKAAWGFYSTIDFALTSLFFRYQELGFVKRGLLATLVSPFIPNQLTVEDASRLIFFISLFAILLLCGILVFFGKDNTGLNKNKILQIAAISPCMFLQLGFTSTFLDVFCLICMTSVIALAQGFRGATIFSKCLRIFLVFFVTIAGAAFHELYLLAFMPVTVVVAFLCDKRLGFTIMAAGIISVCLIYFFGRYEAGAASLEEAIRSHYIDGGPKIINTRELVSSLRENIRFSLAKSSIPGLAYLVILVSCINKTKVQHLLIILASFTPLLLVPLGVDHGRWMGFVGFNLISLCIAGRIAVSIKTSIQWFTIILLSSFGPMGIFSQRDAGFGFIGLLTTAVRKPLGI